MILERTPKWADLRKMSDEEVIARYDTICPDTWDSVNYYLEEMRDRRHMGLARAVKNYTRSMTNTTVIITLATLTNLVLILGGK